MARHFLSILDVDRATAFQILDRAKAIKTSGATAKPMTGKTAILIFEKASTRTRVSFEVAVTRLGGSTVFMSNSDSQLGRGEPLRDTARVLSRYADCLIVRTFAQSNLETLAEYATIPVVNALSDSFHPCQVMSDLLTIYERSSQFSGLKVSWLGDGNNMANSWINAAVYFPFELHIATPEGYEPDAFVLERALKLGAKITLTRDPAEAVRGAHYLNTDVWASMGQEEEKEIRARIFAPYQINDETLKLADPACKVMHCLPAYRGLEITNEVMEGPQSIVWDQAENRLHMQMAILEWLMTAQ